MAEQHWREELGRKAEQSGFSDVRIAAAGLPVQYGERLNQWLALGLHGEMAYMQKTAAMRVQGAESVLPGARSVIVFLAPYFSRPESRPMESRSGKVAKYALGRDYHIVFRERLQPIADWLANTHPNNQWRIVTDSAPLNERAFAVESGIGFYGKNTMVISPWRGSFFLLAEVVTTAALPADAPVTGTCGTCTRCITACPTGALDTPFQVDATKCISYLTIEKKSPMTADEHEAAGDWLFGCDICQDICPYNKHPEETRIQDFENGVRMEADQPLDAILQLESNSRFEKHFAESPLLRPGRRRVVARATYIAEHAEPTITPTEVSKDL